MKNGGLLNRIFNVDRGNEENEDDTSSREVFYWIVQGRGSPFHFFLSFPFAKTFLRSSKRQGKRERERESYYLRIFLWTPRVEEGGRVGGVGMDFRRLGVGYIVLSSYGNEIELERFCFYGCNLERLRVNGIDFTKRSPGIRDTRALSQDLRK